MPSSRRPQRAPKQDANPFPGTDPLCFGLDSVIIPSPTRPLQGQSTLPRRPGRRRPGR